MHELDCTREKTGARGFGGEGKEFMNCCGDEGEDIVEETNIVCRSEAEVVAIVF